MGARPRIDGTTAVHEQLRRVRRRWNAREMQRGLYRAGALLVAAAAVLLALGMWAQPRAFAVVAWAVALGGTIGTILIGRSLRRAWLGRARAARVIDRLSGLGGRLATLVELPRTATEPPLLPLLRAQTAAMAARWRPDRLVPHAVPGGALGAAAAAGVALLLVLAMAGALRPTRPGRGPLGVTPRSRVVLRQLEGGGPRPGELAPHAVADAGPEAERSWVLVALPRALQESIQETLWGESALEDRPDSAAGGNETERWGDGDAGASDPVGGLADVARADGSATDGADGQPRTADPDGEWADAAPVRRAASGAGSGTDPDLFGAPSDAAHRDATPFGLGIRARVRAVPGAPRRPEGTPPSAPDARPTLAGRQEAEEALARVIVPPAWEPLVRALYAHGDPPAARSSR